MRRFLIGLACGTVLTIESLFLSKGGHGTYAPWLFTASLLMFVPAISFLAGPLLWALYFLITPDLETTASRVLAVLLIVSGHAVPGVWLALEDPAFRRLNSLELFVFLITILSTLSLLVFFCFRPRTAGEVVS